jgi:hypothetical protein
MTASDVSYGYGEIAVFLKERWSRTSIGSIVFVHIVNSVASTKHLN